MNRTFKLYALVGMVALSGCKKSSSEPNDSGVKTVLDVKSVEPYGDHGLKKVYCKDDGNHIEIVSQFQMDNQKSLFVCNPLTSNHIVEAISTDPNEKDPYKQNFQVKCANNYSRIATMKQIDHGWVCRTVFECSCTVDYWTNGFYESHQNVGPIKFMALDETMARTIVTSGGLCFLSSSPRIPTKYFLHSSISNVNCKQASVQDDGASIANSP